MIQIAAILNGRIIAATHREFKEACTFFYMAESGKLKALVQFNSLLGYPSFEVYSTLLSAPDAKDVCEAIDQFLIERIPLTSGALYSFISDDNRPLARNYGNTRCVDFPKLVASAK